MPETDELQISFLAEMTRRPDAGSPAPCDIEACVDLHESLRRELRAARADALACLLAGNTDPLADTDPALCDVRAPGRMVERNLRDARLSELASRSAFTTARCTAFLLALAVGKRMRAFLQEVYATGILDRECAQSQADMDALLARLQHRPAADRAAVQVGHLAANAVIANTEDIGPASELATTIVFGLSVRNALLMPMLYTSLVFNTTAPFVTVLQRSLSGARLDRALDIMWRGRVADK